MFSFLRTKKLGDYSQVAGTAGHNTRSIPAGHVDAEKSNLNQVLVGAGNPAEIVAMAKALISKNGIKPRKNSVLCIETILTASPEFFEMYPEKYQEWLDSSVKYLEKTFGKENIISIVVHLDEETPHIHALTVPIDKTLKPEKTKSNGEKVKQRGGNVRLNAKKWLGSPQKLSKMQTEYNNAVSHLGLVRGIEKSNAKHTPPKEYRAIFNEAFDEVKKNHEVKLNFLEIERELEKIRKKYQYTSDTNLRLIREILSEIEQSVKKKELIEQQLKKVNSNLEKITTDLDNTKALVKKIEDKKTYFESVKGTKYNELKSISTEIESTIERIEEKKEELSIKNSELSNVDITIKAKEEEFKIKVEELKEISTECTKIDTQILKGKSLIKALKETYYNVCDELPGTVNDFIKNHAKILLKDGESISGKIYFVADGVGKIYDSKLGKFTLVLVDDQFFDKNCRVTRKGNSFTVQKEKVKEITMPQQPGRSFS